MATVTPGKHSCTNVCVLMHLPLYQFFVREYPLYVYGAMYNTLYMYTQDCLVFCLFCPLLFLAGVTVKFAPPLDKVIATLLVF